MKYDQEIKANGGFTERERERDGSPQKLWSLPGLMYQTVAPLPANLKEKEGFIATFANEDEELLPSTLSHGQLRAEWSSFSHLEENGEEVVFRLLSLDPFPVCLLIIHISVFLLDGSGGHL
jgi:hypothetical protein